ncbi:uncharacterized protein L969DRAFT_94583 [Mixia osmundae IAM 14324]|uniref:Uncharacterized protein n=1 Tax=Mixia osmundae (strain CBS 9802 / IAM 14324 / JCM 22182 / KY 12970) TaxID=764103 RepID=G7DVM0_MIXOS|nr:uncharacterized protein L969DRAFT_94583 [Mixia osmundae IAM 14324]KEI39526.1 hypothetical protein L969DRAFT_94583 [Mixia osmundae IAM 14324]GAA94630.1 hypothetical protein E5Q_01282 [Mixia osmundae IAM 14324]
MSSEPELTSRDSTGFKQDVQDKGQAVKGGEDEQAGASVVPDQEQRKGLVQHEDEELEAHQAQQSVAAFAHCSLGLMVCQCLQYEHLFACQHPVCFRMSRLCRLGFRVVQLNDGGLASCRRS